MLEMRGGNVRMILGFPLMCSNLGKKKLLFSKFSKKTMKIARTVKFSS